MSRRIQIVSAFSVVALVLASCGGGDSSSRTKNSALCYATQEEKDAAVKAAQDAFDAAMGGAPTDDSIAPTDSTVVTDSTFESDESHLTDTTTPALEEAFGGGYRRPAVRAASSGDTTVPPAGDSGSEGEGEGDGTLTPEQQQAQMDLETAESQPLCDEGSESADQVTCTATFTGIEVTDDCEEGDVIAVETDESLAAGIVAWQLIASGTETVLAQNQFPSTELYDESGSAVPYIVEVAYQANSGNEESSSAPCTATVTSTGISWDCPNGELFNVAIEDMSNPGIYPSVECASSGSHTVAEGQRFWFNFHLVNGDQTFLEGWNYDRELDTPIEFEVPADTEGVCAGDDAGEIDWESLEFEGVLDGESRLFSFTVPEDFEGPVYVKFESADEFDFDFEGADFISSLETEDECTTICERWSGEFSPGSYTIELTYSYGSINWRSNVEITPVPFEYPDLPFSYVSDGSETTYVFSVSETQTVVLAATAGETCEMNEDGDVGNGFADPEIKLIGLGIDEDDDDSGRGPGHCSASLLEIELQPGKYTVTVEDDDGEGGDITLSSSVELEEGELQWDLTSRRVTPDFTFDVSVPESGAWFTAKVLTDNFAAVEEAAEFNIFGCFRGDENCSRSLMVMLDAEGLIVAEDGNGENSFGEIWTTSSVPGGFRYETNNYGSTRIEVFLPAGEYTVAVMDCCGPLEEGEVSPNEYELQYGFGTFGAGPVPSVGDVKDTNADIPNVGSSANLSASLLTRDSSVSTAISSQVEVLLCDAACIEGMFATAGIADGTITVRAGGEEVVIRKGQSNAKIPVSAGASRISAVAKSADGSTTVNLGSNFTQLPEDIQASFESKSSSGDGSGFNMLYLLLLIPVLGAIFVVVRRKQASASL